MKVIFGFEYAVDPIEGSNAPVRQVFHIVDPCRGRMGDKHIQKPAKAQVIEQQFGDKHQCPKPHFKLGVLIRSIIVVTAAFDPGNEKPPEVDTFPMDIYTTPWSQLRAGNRKFNLVGMVAVDKKQLFIQHTNKVFQVGV